MKNYIVTFNEYEIIQKRLNRLKDKKLKLQNKILNITSNIKTVVVDGGTSDDKMANYVATIELLDKEIEEKENELNELKSDLDYMDARLNNIQDLKEQVFVMYFIRGMKVKEIAVNIPCDLSTVYKKIKEINKERELAKKSQNYCDIM